MAESGSSQGGYTGDYGSSVAVREQDRFVPITDISWIMSKAIPENARISKDAKEFMQKCVSNFISFVTIEASNKCQREKRKIINGDDLVWAMAALGCYEYVRPLRFNLQLYREQAELNVDPGESGRSGVCDASEEDRKQYMFLPITNIGRIMRKAIPENCKISKGAKESVQECASEFISFVTCEANYKCLQERRKALDGEDVVNAMATLGFDEYVEPLKQYLQLYREAEGSCKGSLSAAKSKRYGASNGDPGAAYNGM